MEVRFRITPAVLYGAQRAMARHVPWMRWAGVWMSVVYPLVMVGITVAYGGTAVGALKGSWATIVSLPILWLVGIPLLQRWSVGRHWRNTPSFQGEQVYDVDASGVRIASAVSSSTIAWDAIVRGAETADFFLLFESKAMALFIPKTAFESEADVERFRGIVRQAIGNRAGALSVVTAQQAVT